MNNYFRFNFHKIYDKSKLGNTAIRILTKGTLEEIYSNEIEHVWIGAFFTLTAYALHSGILSISTTSSAILIIYLQYVFYFQVT